MGSKTTTHTVDGSSIETKMVETAREPANWYSWETVIRVGLNDNVKVERNCYGSAEVTINGVTRHLTPQEAEHITIVGQG